MNSGNFAYFDYGAAANMKVYGQLQPPNIPLNDIDGVPVALFVGDSDELATVEDNEKLYKEIYDTVVHYKVYRLGHLSFLAGRDMSYFSKDAMDLI